MWSDWAFRHWSVISIEDIVTRLSNEWSLDQIDAMKFSVYLICSGKDS